MLLLHSSWLSFPREAGPTPEHTHAFLFLQCIEWRGQTLFKSAFLVLLPRYSFISRHLARFCCHFRPIRHRIITPTAEPTLHPHSGPPHFDIFFGLILTKCVRLVSFPTDPHLGWTKDSATNQRAGVMAIPLHSPLSGPITSYGNVCVTGKGVIQGW